MEGRLWKILLAVLPESEAGKSRFTYDRRTVLMTLLWAVLHDRPQSWACDPDNWPAALRPRSLPHPSTLSRRKRRDDVLGRLREVHRAVLDRVGPATRDGVIDSRPSVVGGATKDPTAHNGRAVGGNACGYRAHMIIDANGLVHGVAVRPMNISEKIVARLLIASAPAPIQRIIGDTNYDSVPLHRIASEHGVRLYTGIRENRVGRRQHPRRVRLLRLLQTEPGRRAMAARDGIERAFGRMSNIACGLKPLPPWVRGFDRVCFWIEAKVLIYNAYLLDQRQRHAAAA